MSLEHTSTPASADIDFLTQKINQETPEFGEAHPFAFFIRSTCAEASVDKDEKNKIIAGCNGSVIFGSIYTDQLWVHPAHRKNGLAHLPALYELPATPIGFAAAEYADAVGFACPSEALDESVGSKTMNPIQTMF